jgi:hypothetical protein
VNDDDIPRINLTRLLVVSWVFALVLITALLVCLVRADRELNASRVTFIETKVEAKDKRRERDTCLKWNDELKASVATLEATAKKFENEHAAEHEQCTDYHEIFNSLTAGIISTDVVLYSMDDKELHKYCHTNWEANIAKNYSGAKLVDYESTELSRSRSGAMFLVTCYWTIPSSLWCGKKGKLP